MMAISFYSGKELQPPLTPERFEEVCARLYTLKEGQRVLVFGRSGQKQHGVDAMSVCATNDRLAIQCKWKGSGKFLSEAEINSEIEKILERKTEYNISRFHILTTSERDTRYLQWAQEANRKLADDGHQLEVVIYSWPDLAGLINEHEDIVRMCTPNEVLLADQVVGKVKEEFGPLIHSSQKEVERFKEIAEESIKNALLAIAERYPFLDAELERELTNLLAKHSVTEFPAVHFEVNQLWGRRAFRCGNIETAGEKFLLAAKYADQDVDYYSIKALGFLLRYDFQGVITLSREAVSLDMYSDRLASHVAQAAIRLPEYADDPLQEIPLRYRESEHVVAVMIDHSIESETWHDMVRDAYQSFPTNFYIQSDYADSILEHILNDLKVSGSGGRLIPPQVARLQNAKDIYARLWNENPLQLGINEPKFASIGCNYVTCLRVLNEADEAIHLVEKALEMGIDSEKFIRNAVDFSIESHNDELARKLASHTTESTSVSALLAYFLNSRRYEDYVSLFETPRAEPSSYDKPLFDTAYTFFHAKLSSLCPMKALTNAEQSAGRDARALCFISQICLEEGDTDAARSYFTRAIDCFDEEASHERFTVALMGMRLRAYDNVIELLEGYVDCAEDTLQLRLLVEAIERSQSPRGKVVFAAILKHHCAIPFYATNMANWFLRDGRPELVINVLEDAGETLPQNADYWLMWVAAYEGLGEPERLPSLLAGVSKCVEGSPLCLAQLAWNLCVYGLRETGLPIGLRAFDSAPYDEDVIHILWRVGVEYAEFDPPVNVDDDSWFVVTDAANNEFEFYGNEPHENPGHEKIRQKFLGRSIDTVIEGPSTFGVARRWHISKLGNRYARKYADLVQTYSARFPESERFVSLNLDEVDGQSYSSKLFELISTLANSVEAEAKLFAENALPLAVFSRLRGKKTFEIAAVLLQSGYSLPTSLPTDLDDVEKLVARVDSYSLLVDGYTAWTLIRVDATCFVRDYYNEIVVTRETMRELRALLFSLKSDDHARWIAGIQHEILYPSDSGRATDISGWIVELSEFIDNIRVEDDGDLSELSLVFQELYEDIPEVSAFGTAANNGYLLVSEDARLRSLAKQQPRCETANIQMLLFTMMADGFLSQDLYSIFLLQLNQLGHTNSACHADWLIDLARIQPSELEDNLEGVMKVWFSKNGIGAAGLQMCRHFLQHIWGDNDIEELQRARITELIVSMMVRNVDVNVELRLAVFWNTNIEGVKAVIRQVCESNDFDLQKIELAMKV